MNPKFQASVQNREDVTYVKLSGVIDEDNELASPERQDRRRDRGHRRLRDRAHQLLRRARLGQLARARSRRTAPRSCSSSARRRSSRRSTWSTTSPGRAWSRASTRRTSAPTATWRRCCSSRRATWPADRRSRRRPAAATSATGRWTSTTWRSPTSRSSRNAKKIVTDSRVDSVINEFTPTDGDRKIRSRTGQHQPRASSGGSKSGPSGVHSSSLPSIPSLPSDPHRDRHGARLGHRLDLGRQRLRLAASPACARRRPRWPSWRRAARRRPDAARAGQVERRCGWSWSASCSSPWASSAS